MTMELCYNCGRPLKVVGYYCARCRSRAVGCPDGATIAARTAEIRRVWTVDTELSRRGRPEPLAIQTVSPPPSRRFRDSER